MKKIAWVALPILLLLAVAAPSCLAAENAAADQQHAPQYSKPPPLQVSGSPLTQKEYFQTALWLAQLHSPIATTPRTDEKIFGITPKKATVLSPMVSAIAIIISIAIAICNMRKNTLALRNDFKFRMYQSGLAEKKKIIFNFLEITSLHHIKQHKFNLVELDIQITLIKELVSTDFSEKANELVRLLKARNAEAVFVNAPSAYPKDINEYSTLYTDLIKETGKILRGEDFDPTLTASK